LTLAEEITEYVAGERAAVRVSDLIVWIGTESQINPAWTRATAEQWHKALLQAIDSGLLVLNGEHVRPAPVLTTHEAKPRQMGLFE
jgi:hypothetical protein